VQESHDINKGQVKPDQLRLQVANDLKEKLSEFNDPKKGIKVMAMLMGIHEKTLKRLIDCENKPGQQTVFKIYRVLCKSQNDAELFEKVPDIIKEFIIKSSPRNFSENIVYQMDLDAELKKDPAFCEIYFLLGTGGVSKEYIAFNYGAYGERLLNKMLDQQVAAPLRKDFYTLGVNQAPLSGDTLSYVGQHLINRFHKPSNGDELGQNYFSLYAQGLSEEAYAKWLEIEKEAFDKKMKIAKDPKNHGNVRAFTQSVVDTLEESPKEFKH